MRIGAECRREDWRGEVGDRGQRGTEKEGVRKMDRGFFFTA